MARATGRSRWWWRRSSSGSTRCPTGSWTRSRTLILTFSLRGADRDLRACAITTREGVMEGQRGDWTQFCGVQGEIYPCKPAIFAATYEEVR